MAVFEAPILSTTDKPSLYRELLLQARSLALERVALREQPRVLGHPARLAPQAIGQLIGTPDRR